MSQKSKVNLQEIRSYEFKRNLTFNKEAINEKERTIEVSFSSENPVSRWYGDEVLGHQNHEVKLDFLRSGSAPLLLDHYLSEQIGVIESARIDDDLVGRAIVRFSSSQKAEEIFKDVKDGIRKNISVGYRINDLVPINEEKYRITDWEPYEISIVSVPADTSVGVGRNQEVNQTNIGELEMSKKLEDSLKNEDQKREKEVDKNNETRQKESPKNEDKIVILNSETEKVRNNEIKRMDEIRAISDKFNLHELGDQAIRSGKNIDEFKNDVLKHFETDPVRHLKSDAIGMDEKEKSSFCMVRALKASVSGDWSEAGLERAVAKEIAKRSGKEVLANGFFIPPDLKYNNRNLQNAATLNQGGYAYQKTHRGDLFLDQLHDYLLLPNLGATVLTGLKGDIDFPVLESGASAGWIQENGDAPEGDAIWGERQIREKTISCYMPITRKLLKGSNPSIEPIINKNMLLALALGSQKAVFYGTGTNNQPTGLANLSGVNSVTFGSIEKPTFKEIVEMESLIDADNALQGSLSYVGSTKMKGHLKTEKIDAGSGLMALVGKEINGYQYNSSNCIQNTDLFFGNWADLLICQFGAIEVLVDVDNRSGRFDVSMFLDLDIVFQRPQSFCIGNGGS